MSERLVRAEKALRAIGPLGEEFIEKLFGTTREYKLSVYYTKGKKLIETVRLYEEIPVGPQEFVESEKYLNCGPGTSDAMFPGVMTEFVELNSGKYDTAVLTGAIGTSKTFLSNFSQAYQLYRLACLRNPHSYYGLLSSDEIVIIFQSITATLAKKLDYARFRELLLKAPWFQAHFPFRRDLESEMVFARKRIIVRPVSGSDTAAIGFNCLSASIDECLIGDTPIATPDGPKRIADIRPGDRVWSMSPRGIVPDYVVQLSVPQYKPVYRLGLANGRGIVGTATHPIAVDDFQYHGIWCSLRHTEGKRVFVCTGISDKHDRDTFGPPEKMAVSKVQLLGYANVYNFETADHHNYFANDVLVHNCNFMQVVENSKQARSSETHTYDQAKELYRAIKERRRSRFMMAGGDLPGMICLISSKQYPGEFTDTIIASRDSELARTGRTTTFLYDKRRWEVRPELFVKSDWFRVFVGDDSRKPRILEPNEKVPDGDQHLVMKVPGEYRQSFEDNMLGSLRDIGGVSTQALHPWIPNVQKIAAAFGSVESILGDEWCDFVAKKVSFDTGKFHRPEEMRFVHLDLGLTSDSAGVACGYIDRFVEVMTSSGEVEIMPFIVFDFLLEVRPPKGDEIKLYEIRSLLYALREEGLNIVWVTADTYQSRDSIQLLKQRGFKAGLRSVDTDLRPYQFLKSAIMEGRIAAPAHEKCKKELRQLEFDPKHKKVDHPPPPLGSKDVSDAMAGVCFGLTMQLMLWVRHGVRAYLPSRLVSGAKDGKNAIDSAEV